MDPNVRHRQIIAIAWVGIGAMIAASAITKVPLLVLATWLAALVVLAITARRNQAEREERLERPRIYRGIAAAVVASAVAGCILALWPSASDRIQLSLPFFAVTALLGYRALVARGPRPALLLVTVACFTWLWGAAVLLFAAGCKCGRGAHAGTHDWIDSASYTVFIGELVLIAALVAVAMHAFRRRTDLLPDARIVSAS